MSRVLWIHAGGSKCGSSALQNYLERHADYLVSNGFAYENKTGLVDAKQVNSGNGVYLFNALTSRYANSTDFYKKIKEVLNSYFLPSAPFAICSSEMLQYLNSDHWREIVQIAKKDKIEIQLVYYVRHVESYALSSYDQMIKRSQETRSFDEYLVDMVWPHASFLREILKVFDQHERCVQVFLYENHKQQLIQHFMNIVLGDKSKNAPTESYDKMVNRSLTSLERELLLKYNRSCDKREYNRNGLSDYLIKVNSEIKSEPICLSRANSEFLMDSFLSDANFVNKTFFDGESVVCVLDPKKSRLSDREVIKTYEAFIEKLLIQLEDSKGSGVNRVLQRIQWAVEHRFDTYEGVPKDFDALAYLCRNTDVLVTTFLPHEHYLLHGKREGRSFSF